MRDGHFEGKVIRYHPNGEKCAMGDYVGGKQAGDWCYYDENGFPTFKETIKKGESTNRKYYFGTFEENYPDEIPKSKISYKNGKKHGPFIEYYHKGTYKLVPQKNDDGSEDLTRVLTGTQIKMQGSYFEDHLDGEILYYSEDGKLNKKEFYDKGNLLKQK